MAAAKQLLQLDALTVPPSDSGSGSGVDHGNAIEHYVQQVHGIAFTFIMSALQFFPAVTLHNTPLRSLEWQPDVTLATAVVKYAKHVADLGADQIDDLPKPMHPVEELYVSSG